MSVLTRALWRTAAVAVAFVAVVPAASVDVVEPAFAFKSSEVDSCGAEASCHGSHINESFLLQKKATTSRVVSPRVSGTDVTQVDVPGSFRSGGASKDKRRHRHRLLASALASVQQQREEAHLWQTALTFGQVAIIVAFGVLLGGCLLSGDSWSAARDTAATEKQQLSATSGANESGRHCLEIKIGGMTCSACSSTVEKSLRSEKGVLSAAVNLVLEKATVVFDASVTTADTIRESVEDVGFEGAILSQHPASEMQGEGRATLHLQLDAHDIEPLGRVVAGLDGVVSLQRVETNIVRITYRPCVVGARTLLAMARKELLGSEIKCAPPQESNPIGDLQRNADRLWFNFKGSLLPAVLVLVITIILPSFALDLGTVYCGIFHMHVATLLVVVLATPVQFCFGADFHVQARKAILRKSPNMDVLVSLATSISFGYAVLVLVDKACNVFGHHAVSMAKGTHRHDGLLVGLNCHALHFFGMAPILMAVVLCGKFMETKAKIQTMESLVRLTACKSQTAQVMVDGREEVVNVELVQLGDTLRVFEGSQVPVDGSLTSKASMWLSEAILTGESTPTEKKQGACLLGGSTVCSGSGFMVATAVGSKTALGEIMTLMSNAQATKTKTQQLANTVAGYFVASVMAASLVVFCAWLWIAETRRVTLPKEFDPESGFDAALFAAKFGVAVLMVACPCAMGLATPTAVMVSTGVAAQMGCLVKSAASIEEGRRVDTVVLDKTGTITEGAPCIGSAALCLDVFEHLPLPTTEQGQESDALPHAVHVGLGGDVVRSTTEEAQERERSFWWLVGAAEAGSDHPIAKSVVEAAQSALGCKAFAAPDQFRYKVGCGVSAVFGSVDVRVGSFSLLEDTLRELKQTLWDGTKLPLVEEWAAMRREARETVVVVHAVVRKQVFLLGAIAVRDAVRQDALPTIQHLQHRGIDVWMCTGDSSSTALAIAKEVGIPEDHVWAEALPKHKADRVAELRELCKGSVLFVGDGINDAPALASADVGVAIGAGARLALDAADVVLVRSELATLVGYLELSQQTVSTIRRNYAWAFVFNVIGLPAAAGMFYPRVVLTPLMAGLAMGMSSTLVVSSSLMLQLFKQPKVSA